MDTDCFDKNCDGDILLQYKKDIAKYPQLTLKEERELVKRAKNGDKKAFDKLINCNLHYVVKYVQKYYPEIQDQMDLIQAGNIGLIRAVETFDSSKGDYLFRYALYFIKKEIYDHIREFCYPVKLSSLYRNLIYKQKEEIDTLTNTFVSEMTNEDYQKLAEELDISDKNLYLLLRIVSAVSFDELDEDDDKLNGEYSYTFNQQYDESNSFYEYKRSVIQSVLDTLTDREKTIVNMYYGLEGNDEMTFEEIGKKFGVSGGRIGQIEHKALRKLRHPNRSYLLREFVDV